MNKGDIEVTNTHLWVHQDSDQSGQLSISPHEVYQAEPTTKLEKVCTAIGVSTLVAWSGTSIGFGIAVLVGASTILAPPLAIIAIVVGAIALLIIAKVAYDRRGAYTTDRFINQSLELAKAIRHPELEKLEQAIADSESLIEEDAHQETAKTTLQSLVDVAQELLPQLREAQELEAQFLEVMRNEEATDEEVDEALGSIKENVGQLENKYSAAPMLRNWFGSQRYSLEATDRIPQQFQECEEAVSELIKAKEPSLMKPFDRRAMVALIHARDEINKQGTTPFADFLHKRYDRQVKSAAVQLTCARGLKLALFRKDRPGIKREIANFKQLSLEQGITISPSLTKLVERSEHILQTYVFVTKVTEPSTFQKVISVIGGLLLGAAVIAGAAALVFFVATFPISLTMIVIVGVIAAIGLAILGFTIYKSVEYAKRNATSAAFLEISHNITTALQLEDDDLDDDLIERATARGQRLLELYPDLRTTERQLLEKALQTAEIIQEKKEGPSTRAVRDPSFLSLHIDAAASASVPASRRASRSDDPASPNSADAGAIPVFAEIQSLENFGWNRASLSGFNTKDLAMILANEQALDAVLDSEKENQIQKALETYKKSLKSLKTQYKKTPVANIIQNRLNGLDLRKNILTAKDEVDNLLDQFSQDEAAVEKQKQDALDLLQKVFAKATTGVSAKYFTYISQKFYIPLDTQIDHATNLKHATRRRNPSEIYSAINEAAHWITTYKKEGKPISQGLISLMDGATIGLIIAAEMKADSEEIRFEIANAHWLVSFYDKNGFPVSENLRTAILRAEETIRLVESPNAPHAQPQQSAHSASAPLVPPAPSSSSGAPKRKPAPRSSASSSSASSSSAAPAPSSQPPKRKSAPKKPAPSSGASSSSASSSSASPGPSSQPSKGKSSPKSGIPDAPPIDFPFDESANGFFIPPPPPEPDDAPKAPEPEREPVNVGSLVKPDASQLVLGIGLLKKRKEEKLQKKSENVKATEEEPKQMEEALAASLATFRQVVQDDPNDEPPVDFD